MSVCLYWRHMPSWHRMEKIKVFNVEWRGMVRFVKSIGIAWLGHVMRMDDRRTPEKILDWKPIGARITERQRKRWIADIEEDMQIIGIKEGRKQCKERDEWKRITEKAKNHTGL